jgi:hypothetical protein
MSERHGSETGGPETQAAAGAGGAAGGGGGFFRRMLDLFIAPGDCFAAVERAPRTWWQPLLVLTLASVALVAFTYDRVILPAQLEALTSRGEISDADLAQAEEVIRSPMVHALGTGGAAVGTPAAALLMALVAHLATGFLLGGGGTFLQTWAVVCYALLVGVLELIVKLPAMLAQGTPEIFFGPALLLERTDSPSFLFQFVKEFDVFTFWKIGLIAVGLALVHRLRMKTVLVTLLGIWLLWALGAATVTTALRG